MATKLRHTITCPFGMAAYVAAISAPDYWETLATSIKAAPGELNSADVDTDTAQVHLTQHIPADKLPSAVTKLVSGDLAIKRSMTWEFHTDAHTTGTFAADVVGAPATTKGTVDATGTADECTIVYTGSVTVRIPLVGGKIEKLIAEKLTDLLDAERDFTVAWHEEHR
ncbi:DUF2505 domain-containing protein [Williamsia sp.]|uniref:DUF2505 domain-containing protein n=1 Tax=Williamsia sp. TaxID=1872085 RepID=UPI001A1FF91F|nr:DUF2505 domain-containing protein [Williamsia sp.]MBJ7288287.1 DUF2505 domain-containing protein [Williamsia sp.]